MKTYLIDLDGTMYKGDSNIDGAIAFIDHCLAHQIPFYFLTNNASRTKKQNVEHMEKLGFSGIKEEHFFTSSMAAARHVKKLDPTHLKAAYIGQAGLAEALLAEGFDLECQQADYLFIGLDRQADYMKYSLALQHCLHGAKLVGTNNDRILAHDDTFYIGNGSIVAMFEYATNQSSLKIGKPHPIILEEALHYFNLNKEDIVVLGDNLETDIALGVNSGVESILVCTGVHQRKDIEKYKIVPTLIVDTLYELIK